MIDRNCRAIADLPVEVFDMFKLSPNWMFLNFVGSRDHAFGVLRRSELLSDRQRIKDLVPQSSYDDPLPEPPSPRAPTPEKTFPTPTDVPVPVPFDVPGRDPIDIPMQTPHDVPPPPSEWPGPREQRPQSKS